MIVPWLRGFLSYQQAPITWMIVVLNILIFVVLSSNPRSQKISRYIQEDESLQISGRLYEQFLQKEKTLESDHLLQNELIRNVSTLRHYEILGARAFQDKQFLLSVQDENFKGDQIAISKWKEEVAIHLDKMDNRNSQIFGLQPENMQQLSWITYQFVHSGFSHILGNMLLVLLFGSAVEMLVGPFMMLFIYLSSGVMAGLFYLFLNSPTWIGVIGASGSLNGLIAFYIFYESKKNVPFFYFIGRHGWIHLPKWTLIPFLVLGDVTSYLTAPEALGTTIAHTAHLGGALMGVAIALVLNASLVFRRSKASA